VGFVFRKARCLPAQIMILLVLTSASVMQKIRTFSCAGFYLMEFEPSHMVIGELDYINASEISPEEAEERAMKAKLRVKA
jgi:hypothetical protein